MDFNLDLNLVQSQKILLTPKLKQAVAILKMSSQELFEYVEEQLESNPVLEILENSMAPEDTGEWIRPRPISINSLKEHLLLQLQTSQLSDIQVPIGEYLIDNIDQNGYLTVPLTEVTRFFNVEINKVEKVLKHLQTFDPSGICARSLKECLLIQLRQMKGINPDIPYLVEHFLNDLGAGRMAEIVESSGMDMQRVQEGYALIKTLEPKPGREFYNSEDVKFIIPDVMIRQERGQMGILLNEDSFPLVNINEYYRKIAASDVTQEVRKYILGKLDHASWLVRCIEQRKSTIYKVTEYIVNREMEFFLKGKKHLKLLKVKDCAQALEIHESILSSTLLGKYLQCLWGVFEMRHFFE